MTAQRQETSGMWPGGSRRPRIVFIALLAFFFLIPLFDAVATTTERVVVNRFSGLAIEGYDPVAYFVVGQPVKGLADFEASQAGAVWRFHNEGNRASFVAHPEVYGPQFGGYDPTDIARGVIVAGNPRFFLVTDKRLYLFSLEANRDAFAGDPERFLAQARQRWPELVETLAQ
jgi:YHS domain-containing protein